MPVKDRLPRVSETWGIIMMSVIHQGVQMPYDHPPETRITAEQSVAAVQAFIDERAASRVLMTDAFTDLELVDGV